ncbi:hypothetical protein BJ878DRAFT_7714 [Calycina marina]|uniref:Uncharacterized protein n=1 Tax=Calycina marina TaxID=1763456 RepID=A0A9P7YU92_9HELO|nr:hypothetical protein BJ878DRAFT_7714 [Calycina marina]
MPFAEQSQQPFRRQPYQKPFQRSRYQHRIVDFAPKPAAAAVPQHQDTQRTQLPAGILKNNNSQFWHLDSSIQRKHFEYQAQAHDHNDSINAVQDQMIDSGPHGYVDGNYNIPEGYLANGLDDYDNAKLAYELSDYTSEGFVGSAVASITTVPKQSVTFWDFSVSIQAWNTQLRSSRVEATSGWYSNEEASINRGELRGSDSVTSWVNCEVNKAMNLRVLRTPGVLT